MQGDDAGLHAEAHEEEDEHEVAPRARRRGPREEVREGERPRPGGEKEEGGDQAARPEVGHGEIEERGAAARPALVIGGHERGGGEAHQLPGHQEAEHAVGREHRLDRQEEHVPGRGDERGPPGRYRVGQVAHAVEGHRRGQDGERHEEPRRERVDRVADGHAGGRVREEHAPDDAAAGEHRGAQDEADERAAGRGEKAPPSGTRRDGGAGRARGQRRSRGGRAPAESRAALIPATRGAGRGRGREPSRSRGRRGGCPPGSPSCARPARSTPRVSGRYTKRSKVGSTSAR